jgi:hypothetical protein
MQSDGTTDGAGGSFAAHGAFHGRQHGVAFLLGVLDGWGGLRGFLAGASVLVFAQGEGFAVEAGQGVEEADVIGGIGFKVVIFEGAEDVGEGQLQEVLLEETAVIEFGQFGAGFAEEAEFGAPFQQAKVLLVAGGEPIGEVFGVEGDALFGEGLDDGFVGGAVIQEAVDEVALSFGKLGDFAFGAGGDFGLVDGVDDGSWHGG